MEWLNYHHLLYYWMVVRTGSVAAASTELKLASPTISVHATMQGVILGTAAYMAPEQARGKTVDKRADIWAFGAVLFEMLTGTRAFPGADVADTLAAVLRADPDWNALPAEVGFPVRTLLRGCLEKDPRRRIADISAALFVLRHQALATAADGPARTSTPGCGFARRSRWGNSRTAARTRSGGRS